MNRIFCKMQCAPSPLALEKNEVLKDRYGALRQFYACTGKYNDVISYIEKGSLSNFGLYEELGQVLKIGLFDANGACTTEQKHKYKEKLQKTSSPIWSGVILFPEEFGANYIQSTLDAMHVMNTAFKDFLKESSFDVDNIEWFAGLHQNHIRKHIHFVMWEKEARKIRAQQKERIYSNAYIPRENCQKFEKNIEKALINAKRDGSHNALIALFNKSDFKLKKEFLELYRILPSIAFSNFEELKVNRYREKLDIISKTLVKKDKNILNHLEVLSEILFKKDSEIEDSLITNPHSIKQISNVYLEKFYQDLMKGVLRELYARKNTAPVYSNSIYKRVEVKKGQQKLMREFSAIKSALTDQSLVKLNHLIEEAKEIDIEQLAQNLKLQARNEVK